MVVEAHVMKHGHDCRLMVHRETVGWVVLEEEDGDIVSVTRVDDWDAVDLMVLEFRNRALREEVGDPSNPERRADLPECPG